MPVDTRVCHIDQVKQQSGSRVGHEAGGEDEHLLDAPQFETRPAGLGALGLVPNVVHYVHPSGDRQALADFKQVNSLGKDDLSRVRKSNLLIS
jgi:hypothetical protein